jgi:hypothetical protein
MVAKHVALDPMPSSWRADSSKGQLVATKFDFAPVIGVISSMVSGNAIIF